jgi:hypothetical protein
MRLVLAQITIVISFIPSLKGQLYLIVGTPDNSPAAYYAADLHEVTGGGVKRTAEILPQNVGLEWVAVSFEWRKAVLQTQFPNDDRILVMDLDAAKVVKDCKLPQAPDLPLDTSLIEQWLADAAGIGPTFEWRVARGLKYAIQGMILDPLAPCEKSFVTLQTSDVRGIVAGGSSGLPASPSDGITIALDEDGSLQWRRRSAGIVDGEAKFDYHVPRELMRDPADNLANIMVNNPQEFVVRLFGSEGPGYFLGFRKSDKTWHRIPVQVENAPGMRAFSSMIAATEIVAKQTPAEPKTAGRATVVTSAPQVRESAGASEWRTQRTRTGPSLAEEFRESPSIYPGRLHIYNIDTEKLFTITTNQGDSEILLIEDNTVYYRVSDRLYKAPITDGGIGAATLMATDEAIRDAHWAFIKH